MILFEWEQERYIPDALIFSYAGELKICDNNQDHAKHFDSDASLLQQGELNE